MTVKYYTEAEVTKIKSEERKKGTVAALNGVLSAVCLELLDKQGLSKNKVYNAMCGARKIFDEIDEGYLDLIDVKKVLVEEYDFEIELT